MSSVRGVGNTNITNQQSSGVNLGVSHLIGPRWTEDKELEFRELKNKVEDLDLTVKFLTILVGIVALFVMTIYCMIFCNAMGV